MNRTAIVIASVVGAGLIFGVVSTQRGQGDDATMIRETLRQSLEASRNGKPGQVLEALSGSLKVNDEEPGGMRGTIVNYIKNQRPDIEVTNPTPIVTGDEARITSPVRIKVSLPLGAGEHSVNVKDVVLVFHKETARQYLIFPVKKWRLAEVQAPPMALDTIGID